MERKRLAVLVGCNYPGTENELHGCINDVVFTHETLVQRFRFIPANIVMLTDVENGIIDQPDYPSGENIKSALSKMIDQAEPGDVLMFHFSGHGNVLGQHDDCIIPSDYNIITDHDFRDLVNRLPKGASFTILSDSCHSGGLIDKEKEQIGDEVTNNSSEDQVTDNSGDDPVTENSSEDHVTGKSGNNSHHRKHHRKHHHKNHKHHKVRGIGHDAIMKHLRSKSGLDSDDIGDHLTHLYGDAASPVFRNEGALERTVRLHPDNGILMSGCQHDELSLDCGGDEPHGAFTKALLLALKELEEPISYEELVRRTRSIITDGGFDQHPCLYSSDTNKDAPFLSEGWN